MAEVLLRRRDALMEPGDFSWQDRANCHDGDPDDFFPDDKYVVNSREHRAAVARAKDHCSACEVREVCLQFAIENRIEDGIWGGLTASGRRSLRWPRRRVDGKLTYDSRAG